MQSVSKVLDTPNKSSKEKKVIIIITYYLVSLLFNMLYFFRMLLKSCKLLEQEVWVAAFVVFYTEKFLHQIHCLLIRELEQIIPQIHSFHWSPQICQLTTTDV